MSTPTTQPANDTNEAPFLAPETHRIADEPKSQSSAGNLMTIPLSLLVHSTLNARKTGGEDVGELAALIKSQGLLQNLIVIPHTTKRGKTTGKYGVVAGGRRLHALQLLAKAGDLAADAEVLCRLITSEQATAASVAENSARAPMSVADTVTAFADMVASGAGVEDVAVYFGITPLTVQRRLKLTRVSPRLFALFRDEQISLDQLMALAISDDHEAQERVWDSAPSYNRHPSTLRRLLLDKQIDAERDAIARFVGLAAYEAAGGAVVRDLFADEAHSGYIVDVELLHRLALERLTTEAERIKPEGWAWVEARTTFDHAERSDFLKMPTRWREPTDAEAVALAALEAEQQEADDALEALYEQDHDGDGAEALELRSSRAAAEIERLRSSMREWPTDAMQFAGAVVGIDQGGDLNVTRGLVKAEDRKVALKAMATIEGDDTAGGSHESGSGKPAHSEALTRRLTAHRTTALQVVLCDNTHVALAALAHALVQPLVLRSFYRIPTALNVRAQECDAESTSAADDLGTSPAWISLQERLAGWRVRMPEDTDALLPWLIAQPQQTLLDLLALCSALSVNTIVRQECAHPGDALAAAVELDMADWWTPTAGSYLNHVPKARIVEDVTDVTGADRAAPLAKLKKGEAVASAEAMLAGSRWLPGPLRPRTA